MKRTIDGEIKKGDRVALFLHGAGYTGTMLWADLEDDIEVICANKIVQHSRNLFNILSKIREFDKKYKFVLPREYVFILKEGVHA